MRRGIGERLKESCRKVILYGRNNGRGKKERKKERTRGDINKCEKGYGSIEGEGKSKERKNGL